MTSTAISQSRILIVDDDRVFRLSTAALLSDDGYVVETVASGQEAVVALRTSHFDAMLLDVKMPGTDGITLLETLRVWGNGIPIVMISGVGTVNDAVRALQIGADDFLTKPVEPDLLSVRIADLLKRRPAHADQSADGMIGRSTVMQTLFAQIAKVAPTESTVLITGETGTGKELVARAVHQQSPRRTGPFVTVDCGALSENLLESELFGHVRGAFTGALRDKAGLFEAASGGTIFLDEIGGVSFALQQRLLRVLQERMTTRVGALRPTQIDVRVIAATNRELRAEIAAGRFREDLFYRLNVFPITLPPLRQRRDDVPVLVQHVLRSIGKTDSAINCCTPFAMHLLRSYAWPGNVRELFSIIESASIRAGNGRIGAQHLPAEVRGVWDVDRSDETESAPRYQSGVAEEAERAAIVSALTQTGGALARSAELLGMGRTTLWRKIKALGISIPDTKSDSD